jgi:hypothetical protein
VQRQIGEDDPVRQRRDAQFLLAGDPQSIGLDRAPRRGP